MLPFARYHQIVTADEIIREIEALPIEARREIGDWLQARIQKDDPEPVSYYELNDVRYIKLEAARPIIEKIFNEHKELFRKLAE